MKRAFTLIELLVVIAIIAILAAILFPVFAQAKEAAKKTSDLSNQKNIVTGSMIYMSDSDDFFPRHVYRFANAEFEPLTWRDALMPYVKNGQGRNPSGTTFAKGGIWESPGKPGFRHSYAANRNIMPAYCYWNNAGWVCDSDDNGIRNPAVPEVPSASATQLDAPALTTLIHNSRSVTPTNPANERWLAMFAEGAWWWYGGAAWPPVLTGPTSHEKWDYDSDEGTIGSRGEPQVIARYRYSLGTNAGFADGHAKFIKKGAYSWCQYQYVKGRNTDMSPSGAFNDDSWMFDPGNACAAFAR